MIQSIVSRFLAILVFILIFVTALMPCKAPSKELSMDGVYSKSYIKVDSVLIPFVNEFVEDCKKYKLDYSSIYTLDSIYVVDFKTREILGLCTDDNCFVMISNAPMNDWNKRLLVYHELGHCVLGFEHRCSLDGGLLIMNPIINIVDTTKCQPWNEMKKDFFLKPGSRCELSHVSVDGYEFPITVKLE